MSIGELLTKRWMDNAIPLLILLVVVATFGSAITDFFGAASITNLMRQWGEFSLLVLALMIVMVAGTREAGFETLLADRWLSPIIVTFFSPADPAFAFDRFYDLMKEKGFIIYPGKLTVVDSFRVGCIGRMDEHVMRRVVEAARASLTEMGVANAAPPAIALAERSRLAA